MSREWRRKWRVISKMSSPYHHNPPKRKSNQKRERERKKDKPALRRYLLASRVSTGGDAANNTTRQGKPLPTVDRWKPSEKKNFRYGTVSFTLSFFFLVGSGSRDGTENSKRETRTRDGKSEKVKKKCVAKMMRRA